MKKIKSTIVAVVVFAFALCTAPAAFADSLMFTFGFTGTGTGAGVSATGTVFGTSEILDPTIYTATGGSISVTDVNGTNTYNLFLPSSTGGIGINDTPDGLYSYDNDLYTTGGNFLDNSGLLFGTPGAGGAKFNYFTDGLGDYRFSWSGILDSNYSAQNTTENNTLNVGPVPEPSSLALLGTGILGGLGLVRRRFVN